MRNRRTGLILVGAILLALAVRHPSADIRILTHDVADPAPHRIQAALDLGLVGVSVLITWTARRIG